MHRIINFLIGFTLGAIIGFGLMLLLTPKSGEELGEIFNKAYASKKAELEARLVHFDGD